MTGSVERHGLKVAAELAAFVELQALPGTGLVPDAFWAGFAALIHDLTPRNRALLAWRAELQGRIDGWHLARRGAPHDARAQQAFLEEIGYLVPEGPPFAIDPGAVDSEIATIAGPQLVVPVMNARFALNAANARWGSLYDALYGTDALGDLPPPGPLDAARGARVVAWGRAFLDLALPLAGAGHGRGPYRVVAGALLADGAPLADPAQFVGHQGPDDAPTLVALKNNGLHILLRFDADHPVGRTDPAHLADVVLEAAVTVIMDCEDSVAAVDAADKVAVYANWLGLMRGDLRETLVKNGREITRSLAPDHHMTGPDGGAVTLPGRALMLVRTVGHLMTTPALLDRDGAEVPEGLMDAMLTTLCALHDIRSGGPRNSAAGAIYMVKPKMHGPQEVAFACDTLDRVEDVLGLARHTVKLGIMDEERRTSANLTECIRAARHRVVFINTGFLDRTGDEIHTGMDAGPMLRKAEMKGAAWLAAYEDRNVDIGLACGFSGRAQIGKGMWAMPDRMADLLAQKGAQPQAGANCAWVPSPTAAVLHATHYHGVDVFARQREIAALGPRATLDALLTPPLAQNARWSEAEIEAEIETNLQGILGYTVRWVDQGVGCSKVPDRQDVALMEDRATCRISSQALANWLVHGIVTPDRMMAALRRMALVVDRQNAADPAYRPMGPGYAGVAFQAACDLVFRGRIQPSGYTEPVLHARRLQAKAAQDGVAPA